jgi:hypothetical protein
VEDYKSREVQLNPAYFFSEEWAIRELLQNNHLAVLLPISPCHCIVRIVEEVRLDEVLWKLILSPPPGFCCVPASGNDEEMRSRCRERRE